MARPHVNRILPAPLALAMSAFLAGPSVADTRPLNPANPATPVTVSADALPTVQINAAVWRQAVIGTTLYGTTLYAAGRRT